MARPKLIRDEDILQAALEVFLQRGATGTTAEVAERAGVSEGTVFNRFTSKSNLFHRALEASEPEWMFGLDSTAGAGDLRERFIDIGLRTIAFFRRLIPLVTLIHADLGRPPTFTREPAALRAVSAFERWFAAEISARRLAQRNPTVLARTFLGAAWHFVSMDTMFGPEYRSSLDETEFLADLFEILWCGLKPATEPLE